jgi:hypothetical protein
MFTPSRPRPPPAAPPLRALARLRARRALLRPAAAGVPCHKAARFAEHTLRFASPVAMPPRHSMPYRNPCPY